MRPFGTGSRILRAGQRWRSQWYPAGPRSPADARGAVARILTLYLVICAALSFFLLAGCRSSGIDPTGRRIFADSPFRCPSLNCPLLAGPQRIPPPGTQFVSPPPPGTTLVSPPPAEAMPLAAQASPPPAAIHAGPSLASQPPVVATPAAAPLAGAVSPDPSVYREFPGRELPWDNVQIVVNPSRCVAPVGSDVVLMAGVVGPDRYLRTNERVEWLLSPEDPGEFLDYGRGTCTDLLVGDFTRPRKIDSHWVITSTSRRYLRLNRETPTASDDVLVARGQSWVTVSSPVEGSSHVTAYAPSVYGWSTKKQTATIHWVDAEWQFPPPAITSAGGRHVFTTTVTRHTDRSPRAGWRVRYEIAGGPPAGFAPDGAPAVEVVTNEAGQATAEIVQPQPVSGTNQINIQVIRPGAIDGDGGKPLVVGSGSTTASWSAPGLTVRKTGPAVGSVGATLSYQIAVTNSGDLPADDVTVSDEIPAGFDLLRTQPQAELAGNQLRWPLGRLDARQTRVFGVDLRASRSGTLTSCAEATAAGGLAARDCVTTVIGEAKIIVRILGPSSATVGEEVRYEIVIENHGDTTATGLLIKERFDEGLDYIGDGRGYAGAESPIKKSLPDLLPGQGNRVGIAFRVARPGSLCHEVEVTGAGGVLATARACVVAAPGAGPPATLPGASPSPGRAEVSVTKTGPATADVGQIAKFVIQVQNTGEVALTNVKVDDVCDPELVSTDATTGFQVTDNGVFWTISSLPIGGSRQFTVQCRCERAAAEAYNRVTVTTAEGAEKRAEARLEIRAAQPPPPTQPAEAQGPGLGMSVLDLADNVGVGRTVTYDVVVDNNSTALDEDLVLELVIPPQLQPIDAEIRGPQGVGHVILGQTVRFDAVRTIRPGGNLHYLVPTKANAPGKIVVRALLRSKNLAKQLKTLTAEQQTEILNMP